MIYGVFTGGQVIEGFAKAGRVEVGVALADDGAFATHDVPHDRVAHAAGFEKRCGGVTQRVKGEGIGFAVAAATGRVFLSVMRADFCDSGVHEQCVELFGKRARGRLRRLTGLIFSSHLRVRL